MDLKLNIGCGRDIKESYLNVDIRKVDISNEADDGRDMSRIFMRLDLEKIPYPFESESIDEILANDIIEHFSYRYIEYIVREWHRILKNGGILRIKTPDFENIIDILKIDGVSFMGGTASLLGDEKKTWMSISHWIFGGQDYSQNFHKLIFTKIELKKFLEYIGFRVGSIIDDNDCRTNMICVATKLVNR